MIKVGWLTAVVPEEICRTLLSNRIPEIIDQKSTVHAVNVIKPEMRVIIIFFIGRSM
jgi:hypothetical protein